MAQQGQQQRYRVIEKLAAGGMAEVFRAESAGIEGFKKKVAIKRVLPHLSKKQKFISMFLDEARLSAHLSHSNVVQVFDIGMGDNTYFIVMEFVDGADLKTIIEHKRKHKQEFLVQEAVFITVKICEGLAYAHELADSDNQTFGIVHRDMSPPNVLITKFGEVKVTDFGLAKATTQLERSEPGIIKGKFSYLSPEAAQGREVDARTDIFAVGIILWEMLAGRKLFQGESDYQTVQLVQRAEIPPFASVNPRVPPELEAVIRRALARDADQRYHSIRELGRDLTSFLYRHGKPVSSFDIAQLVLETVAARQKERRVPNTSIIDKLIEEALFEFTSLRSNDESDAKKNQAKLRGPQFASMHDWASEINIKNPYATQTVTHDSLQANLPAGIFEEGNLAALEELPALPSPVPNEPSSSRVAASMRGSAPPSYTPPSAPPTTTIQATLSDQLEPDSIAPPPSKKSGSGVTIAILVVIVLVVGGAVAWFAGIIPH